MIALFTRLRSPAALAVVVAASIAASMASAANPHAGGLAAERPLHVRLAQADAVAIGSVSSIDLGRIQVRDAVGLGGAVAADFELKRAPSRPPGLQPGDRVLLLLRGQRSPYLLVDRAAEILRVDDAGGVVAWRDALAALRTVGDRPRERVALYARWLDRARPDLRRAALLGLGAEPSLPLAIAERLAREATDPSVAPDLRLAAARAAGRSEVGSRELFSRLPGSSAVDLEVLAAAFASPFGRADEARSAGPSPIRGPTCGSSDSATARTAVWPRTRAPRSNGSPTMTPTRTSAPRPNAHFVDQTKTAPAVEGVGIALKPKNSASGPKIGLSPDSPSVDRFVAAYSCRGRGALPGLRRGRPEPAKRRTGDRWPGALEHTGGVVVDLGRRHPTSQ